MKKTTRGDASLQLNAIISRFLCSIQWFSDCFIATSVIDLFHERVIAMSDKKNRIDLQPII